eukprot:m51a1_g4640 putative ras guanine nucleotide exchange (586) ;mRNA; r:341555-343728
MEDVPSSRSPRSLAVPQPQPLAICHKHHSSTSIAFHETPSPTLSPSPSPAPICGNPLASSSSPSSAVQLARFTRFLSASASVSAGITPPPPAQLLTRSPRESFDGGASVACVPRSPLLSWDPDAEVVFPSEEALLSCKARPPAPRGPAPSALEAWEPPLPAGWAERREPGTALRYYVRDDDSAAQWVRPSLEPADEQRERMKATVRACLRMDEDANDVLDALLCAHPRDFSLVSPRALLSMLQEAATGTHMPEVPIGNPGAGGEPTDADNAALCTRKGQLRACKAVDDWLANYPEDFRDPDMAELTSDLARKLEGSGMKLTAQKIAAKLSEVAYAQPPVSPPPLSYVSDHKRSDDAFSPLGVSPLSFAKAMKWVHTEMFRRITKRAFVLPKYKEACTRMARQFDHLVLWAVTLVVQQLSKSARSNALTFLVELADSLWNMRDYHGCLAIVVALSSQDVLSLRTAWGMVEKTVLKAFRTLQDRCDPIDGSYPRLIEALCTPSSISTVPHIGSYRLFVERLSAVYEPPARCLHIGRLLNSVSLLQAQTPQSPAVTLERAILYIQDIERHILPDTQRHAMAAAISANE